MYYKDLLIYFAGIGGLIFIIKNVIIVVDYVVERFKTIKFYRNMERTIYSMDKYERERK